MSNALERDQVCSCMTLKRVQEENERLRKALEDVLGALSVWRPQGVRPVSGDCTSGYPEWVRRAWNSAIDVLGGAGPTTKEQEHPIEETADVRSGCWAQCGQMIERGTRRVRWGKFLFHPDCWNRIDVGNSGPMVPMCEKHGWWPVPHLIYAGPTGSGSLCGVCAAEEIIAAWEAARPGRDQP